jgi:hypothetical protein
VVVVNSVRDLALGEFTTSKVGSRTVLMLTSATQDHLIKSLGKLLREDRELKRSD